MPPLIAHAIDAWLGKGGSVELADAILLHVPDEGQFLAIKSSRRLKPFLLDSPGKALAPGRSQGPQEAGRLAPGAGLPRRP